MREDYVNQESQLVKLPSEEHVKVVEGVPVRPIRSFPYTEQYKVQEYKHGGDCNQS